MDYSVVINPHEPETGSYSTVYQCSWSLSLESARSFPPPRHARNLATIGGTGGAHHAPAIRAREDAAATIENGSARHAPDCRRFPEEAFLRQPRRGVRGGN